jgi:NFU1 iron-sulfur cluster scaffold homolog, mitochondrial
VSEVIALHVERTVNPLVLRWVTHDSVGESGRRMPPPESGLSSFVVTVQANSILVTFPSEIDVARSVAAVQAALIAALSEESGWLFTPVDGGADSNVSKESVEAVIEAAVGPLLASHGGSIEVVSVTSGVANVRLHGACRGCAGAGSTLHGLVKTALLRAHPGLVDVRELADKVNVGNEISSAQPVSIRSRLRGRSAR